MSARFEAKVLGLDALREAVEQGRLARPLVFTNGVFDILHRGHVSYLDEAAQRLGLTPQALVAAVSPEAARSARFTAVDLQQHGPATAGSVDGDGASVSGTRGGSPAGKRPGRRVPRPGGPGPGCRPVRR